MATESQLICALFNLDLDTMETFEVPRLREVSEEMSDQVSREWKPDNSNEIRETEQILTLLDKPEKEIVCGEEEATASKDILDPKSMLNCKTYTVARGKRGIYNNYTLEQEENLFKLVFEKGMSASSASLHTGIAVRTGQNYVRQEKISRGIIPSPNESEIKPAKTGHRKLFDEHMSFLLRYFEENPAADLSQALTALCNKFDDLELTLTGLHKYLVKKCCLTLKKLEKPSMKRNCMETIELRHQKMLEWQSLEGFDYKTNCVFIGEANFNMHIKQTFGSSTQNVPAKMVVPIQRGINLTIFGAICEDGIINLELKKPEAVVSKKRMIENRKSNKMNNRTGTRIEHYLDFIRNTLNVLDQANMKGRYLIMNNSPFHKSEREVKTLIESRGYKLLYLQTYSPIEEFWSKVKFGIRREQLSKKNQLTPRIIEAARKVTVSDCKKWIEESISLSKSCLIKEEDL